jgi:hypothetical protein
MGFDVRSSDFYHSLASRIREYDFPANMRCQFLLDEASPSELLRAALSERDSGREMAKDIISEMFREVFFEEDF